MDCIGEAAVKGAIPKNQSKEFSTISYPNEILNRRSEQLSYRIFKRLIDVTISVIFIIVQAPIIVLLAFLIKLDSPGPILIRQKRIGKNRRRKVYNTHSFDRRKRNMRGQPFIMYKFRSMHMNSNLYDVKPTSITDTRITRLGRFLRRSCLDEIPQVINVLKGDMSLVGPRPELEFIVQEYDDHQLQRLQVKPGITGLWQLKGSRKKHIHEDIHLDLEYIRRQSLKTDFYILLQTLKFAFFLRNF
ncbi:MAG: sugar transferase [Deferribacteres bacterium]|nr:sugar transferase [candidate division KSB1 bacterium]MCB9501473.1 sugar transferase [Deferribacteres bacterium]